VVSNKLSRRRSYAGMPKVCKAPPALPPVPPPPPPPYPPETLTGHIHLKWTADETDYEIETDYTAEREPGTNYYHYSGYPTYPYADTEIALDEPSSTMLVATWGWIDDSSCYCEVFTYPINWGVHELYLINAWDTLEPDTLDAIQTVQT